MSPSIKLPARIESLEGFISFVSDCSRTLGLPPQRLSDLQLALEEAIVNICRYAYPEEMRDIEVICLEEGSRLVVEVIDTGLPFNPLSQADPDLSAGIAEREIGGLGIFLIRKLMDEVRYRREGDRNVLELVLYARDDSLSRPQSPDSGQPSG